ncbi:MAG: peroxiredoxin-like family protein [Hyphomicrobiaceae bacterium]
MSEQPLEQALTDAMAVEGPLARRLDYFADRLRVLAPAYAEQYDRIIARLVAAGACNDAPREGDLMPDFALPSVDGRIVTLTEMLQSGPVVVTFKRGHWCEFCLIELDGLSRAATEIEAHGARVVALFPETAKPLANLKSVLGGQFWMLSDIDSAYALRLGLAIPVDEVLRQMLLASGIDLMELQAGSGAILPVPATFVVGQNGRIAARFVEPDFRTRMETADLVAALDRLA